MAQCASVYPLIFYNFQIVQDAVIVKYDDTKCDKDGERLLGGNIYANNNDYYFLFWTGLGI